MWKAMKAGVAGACALTALHETVRRVAPHPPRMDIVGMRAIGKSMRAARRDPPAKLREVALAGDLVSNSAFYSLVGAAGRDKALLTGTLLGLGAGIGALFLPGPLGLGSAPSLRTRATQFMTLALYVAGGVTAGAAYKTMR